MQVDKVTTIPGEGGTPIHGIQITSGFGAPQAEVHTKFGYGEIITTPVTIDFKDVPRELLQWIF